jgi:hypothetical protein
MSKINKILNSIKLNRSETDINKLINQNLKIKNIGQLFFLQKVNYGTYRFFLFKMFYLYNF